MHVGRDGDSSFQSGRNVFMAQLPPFCPLSVVPTSNVDVRSTLPPPPAVCAGDTRGALVPFLAHLYYACGQGSAVGSRPSGTGSAGSRTGSGTGGTGSEPYKWMLYGDDDTLFYLRGKYVGWTPPDWLVSLSAAASLVVGTKGSASTCPRQAQPSSVGWGGWGVLGTGRMWHQPLLLVSWSVESDCIIGTRHSSWCDPIQAKPGSHVHLLYPRAHWWCAAPPHRPQV